MKDYAQPDDGAGVVTTFLVGAVALVAGIIGSTVARNDAPASQVSVDSCSDVAALVDQEALKLSSPRIRMTNGTNTDGLHSYHQTYKFADGKTIECIETLAPPQ